MTRRALVNGHEPCFSALLHAAHNARGLATVTLNRPAVNNAYDGDMIAGLHEAMDAVRDAGEH